MTWLERAAAAANLAADREHVTLWLKRNPALKRVKTLDGPGGGLQALVAGPSISPKISRSSARSGR